MLHNAINKTSQHRQKTLAPPFFPSRYATSPFFPPLRRVAQSISCVNCDNHQRVFGIFSYKMKRCIHYQARAHGSAMPHYVTTICQLFNMKPCRLQGGRERAQEGKRIPSFVCTSLKSILSDTVLSMNHLLYRWIWKALLTYSASVEVQVKARLTASVCLWCNIQNVSHHNVDFNCDRLRQHWGHGRAGLGPHTWQNKWSNFGYGRVTYCIPHTLISQMKWIAVFYSYFPTHSSQVNKEAWDLFPTRSAWVHFHLCIGGMYFLLKSSED